ncbi:MAG: hypothetical protein ACYDIC_01730 [Desulfobaccales bacterium]
MKTFFIFFLRLFFCFVAAKFLLRVLGLDSQAYLIGLTVILLGNIYWFDFLEYRDRIAFRLREPEKPAPETAETPSSENAAQG